MCAHASASAGAATRRRGTATPAVGFPPLRRTQDNSPLTATVLRDAPSRRFLRFERRPVVTRARLSPFWRSVAATSHAFFGDPTVGSAISSLRRNLVSRGQLRQLVSPPPQLRLACYQFRCEAGLCGFSGTPYTYQLFRLSRRIAWRCLLA
ncbi:putative proline-rich receptor-like protein kinase PERK13 [Iris pallida]|uniref:Proline-rich receptor-like protein kinase PERK13 n=1 Tax=Iris pallida TaxID=29817 RepID=A0AAX6DKK6_IRIPA|nr:putative proline-rich receptor-like protein kinase PERK13 [Iris pallida]